MPLGMGFPLPTPTAHSSFVWLLLTPVSLAVPSVTPLITMVDYADLAG